MHTLTQKEKQLSFALVLTLFIGSFIWYGYRCIHTDVCHSGVVERAIRPTIEAVMPNGQVVIAEVAETNQAREAGLSGRVSLKENRGMIFEFPLPGRYGFWMKDMLFPIDIIWMTEDGVVVNIVEQARPEDYPTTYVNQAAASYVLEIGANTARNYGIYLGSVIQLKK